MFFSQLGKVMSSINCFSLFNRIIYFFVDYFLAIQTVVLILLPNYLKMIGVRDSVFYKDVQKELNYPFGNIYIFKNFVVSEMNAGITYSWDVQGKIIANDVSLYLGTMGDDVIYISNRINSYAVVPTDWFKFFKNYKLKNYVIVSDNKIGALNSAIENLFFNNKIKRFNSLYEAVNWVTTDLINVK